mgnify:CR=1 FL=1
MTWDIKWTSKSFIANDYYTTEWKVPMSAFRYREGETKWRFGSYQRDSKNTSWNMWHKVPEDQDFSDMANEIRALFDNLEYEDGFSVTEGFKSDYDYHFIKVGVSNNSSISTVNKIVDYFNNNPLFTELKERNLQRISSIISDNKQTINQIDKLLDYYTSENKTKTTQLYIDNKDVRPNELIKTKISLQNENQELKKEILVTKETVMVLNEANILIENNSILSNKMVYYPLLFLFIYIIISIVISLYLYLDKLDRAS